MQNPIAVLQKKGINITNYLGAVQNVKELNWTNGKQYREAITELAGDVSEFGAFDDLTAKYFYLYLVQNVVRRHTGVDVVTAEQLLSNSFSSALNMAERVRHGDMSFAASLEDNAALICGTIVDENGEVVQVRSGRKGEKKDRAIELYTTNRDKITRNEMIALFMKELDMSKAGATTYVYNCKKEVG